MTLMTNDLKDHTVLYSGFAEIPRLRSERQGGRALEMTKEGIRDVFRVSFFVVRELHLKQILLQFT